MDRKSRNVNTRKGETMHYQKDIRLGDTFIEIVRYTEDGPVWLHLLDKNSSFTRSFPYRDAARLGWALLDGASEQGQPYPVKAGE
jgi:hypothetical protein